MLLPDDLSPLGRAALAYAERLGWPVLPLAPRDKVPLLKKKKGAKGGFYDATTDPGVIAGWWRAEPNANIGLATGRGAGVFVLDVDPRDGGDVALDELESEFGRLPDTVRQHTGDGFHLFFALPNAGRVSSRNFVPHGIQVRGDGGYVVLAPSVHPSGKLYTWEASSRPGELPFAPAPEWVLARLRGGGGAGGAKAPAKAAQGGAPGPAVSAEGEGRDARRSWLGAAFAAAGWLGDLVLRNDAGEDGRRKAICPWRATHTIGRDFDSSTVVCPPKPGKTMGWFQCSHSHCERRSLKELFLVLPPEARAAADLEYPKRVRAEGEGPGAAPADAPAPPPVDPSESDASHRATGTDGPAPLRQPATRAPDAVLPLFYRGSEPELAARMLDVLSTGPMTWDEGEFWRYDKALGIWQKLPTETLESVLVGFDGAIVRGKKEVKPLSMSSRLAKGALQFARTILLTRTAKPVTFENVTPGLAFRNGFVTLDASGSLCLRPHAPTHRARHALPFDYAADAPRPMLLSFLEEVFGDCDEQEKADRIACLQEFVGGALLGLSCKYEKALLLTGTGGNGKSQILAIAESVFPPDTVAHLPPQDWGERFRTVSLVGKLANFVPEIPSTDLTASNVLKSAITGEVLYAEKKGRDVFTFVPRAGHIFSANMLPATRDTSEGFFRRFVILSLTRKFSDSDERIERLGQKIAHAELPGLVAWALAGAARLERQRDYTVAEGSRREWELWREESDHIRTFLVQFDWKQHGSLSRGGWGVSAAGFYEHYRGWCDRNGFSRVTSTTFGRRAEPTGLVVKRVHDGRRFFYPTTPAAPPAGAGEGGAP